MTMFSDPKPQTTMLQTESTSAQSPAQEKISANQDIAWKRTMSFTDKRIKFPPRSTFASSVVGWRSFSIQKQMQLYEAAATYFISKIQATAEDNAMSLQEKYFEKEADLSQTISSLLSQKWQEATKAEVQRQFAIRYQNELLQCEKKRRYKACTTQWLIHTEIELLFNEELQEITNPYHHEKNKLLRELNDNIQDPNTSEKIKKRTTSLRDIVNSFTLHNLRHLGARRIEQEAIAILQKTERSQNKL